MYRCYSHCLQVWVKVADIPTSQNLTQSHFVEGSHAQIKTWEEAQASGALQIRRIGAKWVFACHQFPRPTPQMQCKSSYPTLILGNIYPYFPPGRIWHKLFFKMRIKRERERSHMLVIGLPGPKFRCKWVIACHWFTKCNVNLYLSLIHLAKKARCNGNLCLSLIPT